MEKEIETQQPVEDISALRSEMFSLITEAESSGIFTNEEGNQWRDGFDACEKIEHMEYLIDIIESFMDSGEEILERIKSLAEHELIDPQTADQMLVEAENSSYQEKIDIVKELNNIIEKTETLKKELVQILSDKEIPNEEKSELIKEFHAINITDKEKLIEKVSYITNKPPKIDNSKQYFNIQQLVNSGNYKHAREILNNAGNKFSGKEYLDLSNKITLLEIKQTRSEILKVA